MTDLILHIPAEQRKLFNQLIEDAKLYHVLRYRELYARASNSMEPGTLERFASEYQESWVRLEDFINNTIMQQISTAKQHG